MVDELRTSDEEVEALKKWWDENGKAIIIGLVIGLGGLIGWQQWKAHKITSAKAASDIYADIQVAGTKQDDKLFMEKTSSLLAKYGNTSYAPLTRFAMAKHFAEAGKWQDAVAPLQDIIKNNRHEGYVHIARVRLANVFIQLDKLDEAMELVTKNDGKEFDSMYKEVEGDIHNRRGEYVKARAAYQAAMNKLSANDQRQQLLSMKLNSVPASANPVSSNKGS